MHDLKDTYYASNGRHQRALEVLDQYVPHEGESTPSSPVELFRVASNAYYDLYNNGLGNVDNRLTPFLDQIQRVVAKGILPDQNTPEIIKAIKGLSEFRNNYLEAIRVSDQLRERGDITTEIDFPEANHLFTSMERLMDAVIEYASQADDPTKPHPALAT